MEGLRLVDSRPQPTLFVLVGLPGAGKTTLARRLEADHSALRLTPDEWMMPLFGLPELGDKRATLEFLLWDLAARALELGLNVVLDYGLWVRSERDDFRARAEAVGACVELIFLDVPEEELWRRLEIRNGDLPPNTFVIDAEELRACIAVFEAPTEEELGSYQVREVGGF